MKKTKILLPFAVLGLLAGLVACNQEPKESTPDGSASSSQAQDEVIKITYSKNLKKLTKGETAWVKSSVEGVTWTSSDTSIATVDADGTVHGINAGTATITASKEGYESVSETVTVVLVKLSISGDSTVAAGAEIQLTAGVEGVTWKTSDATIATVDQTGKVTGVKVGQVDITVEKDGFDAGKKTITVTRPAANLKIDMTTDADHYSADGWWSLPSSGGMMFSMENLEGYTPIMSAMSWGQETDTDPYIGGFDTGDKETVKFNSTKDNNAEILLNIGNADEINLAEVMTVKLNHKAIDLTGKTLEAHAGDWGNTMTFQDLSLGEAKLNNGENTLVFEFLGSNAPRLNEISLFAGDAAITLVAPAAKAQIQVEAKELSVIEEQTVQIVTTETGVTYTAVDETIATVDDKGLVTGVKVGKTDITVRKEGMYSVRVNITVNPKPVAGQIIVEAEDAEELQGEDKPSGIMVQADGGQWGGSEVHSGGKYIMAWGASGVTLTYKFEAPAAATMVFSVVGSAPMSMGGEASDFVFKDATTIKFNDADYNPGEAKFPAPQGYTSTMSEVTLGDVAVKKGENTFSITFGDSTPSLDCFKLSVK